MTDRFLRHEREALIEEGFCVVPNVLDGEFVALLNREITRLAMSVPPGDRARRRSQGVMLSAMAHPLLADLIAHPPALEALAAMQFSDPTFTDGYIISKPPHSPRLFWHYDWFAWNHPSAYEADPLQVFFMYYLVDTRVANGCLRVLPGSHRTHHRIHDQIDNPHSQGLSSAEDLGDPAFSSQPDERDVPVRAGDLVIGDARLLHAAHANASDRWRPVITLWFQPAFSRLAPSIKAQMVKKTQPIPDDWPSSARRKVAALHPSYDGDAHANPRVLYRRRATSTTHPRE